MKKLRAEAAVSVSGSGFGVEPSITVGTEAESIENCLLALEVLDLNTDED